MHKLLMPPEPADSLAARAWVAVCLSLAAGEVPLLELEGGGVNADLLRDAGAALADHDLVFAAAPSGTVVLLGLRRAVPELFAGSPDGLRATTLRARARWRGVSYLELALPQHA